jgi:hypothetical protein
VREADDLLDGSERKGENCRSLPGGTVRPSSGGLVIGGRWYAAQGSYVIFTRTRLPRAPGACMVAVTRREGYRLIVGSDFSSRSINVDSITSWCFLGTGARRAGGTGASLLEEQARENSPAISILQHYELRCMPDLLV